MDGSEEKLISLTEAAEIAEVDARTLRRAIAQGSLEAQKIGRNWITTPRAVKEWKAADVHKPGPKKK
jgi:excisionase family DNA binding protein